MIARFTHLMNQWTAWWMQPGSHRGSERAIQLLGFLTAIYFADALMDARVWFGDEGLHRADAVGEFLQLSGLSDAARYSVSPLFWTDSLWVVRGVGLAAFTLAGCIIVLPSKRWLRVMLWLIVIAWANRLMWLAGLTENLLSLCWFASLFSPGTSDIGESAKPNLGQGVANRLWALQGSLFAAGTFATMLAGEVWWDATGSIALASPASQLGWERVTWIATPILYEPLTIFLVVLSPIGLILAWQRRTSRWGVGLLWAWAGLIALVGGYWIYGGLLAFSFHAIHNVVQGSQQGDDSFSPDASQSQPAA